MVASFLTRRLLHSVVLFVAVIVPALSPSAAPLQQQPVSAGAVTQSPPPPPSAANLRKLVAFLTMSWRAGGRLTEGRGTAFFVLFEDKRIGEDGGFVYLVTNRHVAEPRDSQGKAVALEKRAIRLNLRRPSNGNESQESELPPTALWYFSPDPSVDIAVMPLLPQQAVYDFAAFPMAGFATKDVVASQGIAEGEPVLFSGFFAQFAGQLRMEPIVRQGILAMMPREKVKTTMGFPGQLYLADVHTFGGNSGSPVFVNLGGMRNGSLSVGVAYRLIGLISGYYYETTDLRLEIATTVAGKADANSGISTVVPVDELRRILELPALKGARDTEVRRKGK